MSGRRPAVASVTAKASTDSTGSDEVHARRADPGDADGDSGDRRAEHASRTHAHLPEDDGIGQQVASDELTGHRHAGWPEKGEGDCLHCRGDEQHPVLDELEGHPEADPRR